MLRLIEFLGILAFGLSGLIEARRTKMDFVGAYATAFLTALGGGTLRDLLLGKQPFWVTHQEYPLTIMALVMGALIVFRLKKLTLTEHTIIIPDGLGLGLFSASGTAAAFDMGLSPFICVLMGVITATFGGVLRDIACNKIPVIFRRTELYATCSFFAAAAYWGGRALGVEHALAATASIVIALGLRVLATKYHLRLPM
jgi:uncharacterized membrane protein YeiH